MPTYRALPLLEIDGQAAPDNLMNDIKQITVEESIHRPGMFSVIVQNDYHPGREEDNIWRYQDLLQIGKSIKIGFTPSSTESKNFDDESSNYLLEGEITAIDTHFSDKSQAPIIIWGYDFLHRFQRGNHNRCFQNVTYSDIVKKIAEETKTKLGTVDNSGEAYEYVFQEDQTNLEFLKGLAARIGFELFIQDGKLNFRKPKADNEVLTLKWLVNLHNFRVRVNSAEQVNEVQVLGWDPANKSQIACTASQTNKITKNQHGQGTEINNQFKGDQSKRKMTVSSQLVRNKGQAESLAAAILEELEGQFICADAKAEGNTKIRPGRLTKLENMGQYTGEYYVAETRHSYCDRVYTTEFSVRGSRSGNLVSGKSAKNQLKPGQTFLVGIVTDNEDPEGWGRVKVKFPTLTQDHTSYWARVVAPGAGSNRGVYWLPEINDEVLVCFEHGDIHRPYILGGVWNGKDPTPRTVGDTVVGGDVRLRVDKTRYGHKRWFVDEDKCGEKRGYYIQTGTGSGHCIRFNDSEQYIEVETIGHHKIRLDDKGKFVEIKTSGGQSLRLDDSSQSTSIKTAGNLSINAQGNIEIKANGTISLNGAIIKLN